MLLKGKICVITGAGSARGLGGATAMLFATHGACVVVLDIDRAAARDTVAALKGRGHMALRCDVTRSGRRRESHSARWPAMAASTCWSTMPGSLRRTGCWMSPMRSMTASWT
jgi:NAD(P)-dependent dehydrogenase (short-subunit alcohol dehydrogenase family)